MPPPSGAHGEGLHWFRIEFAGGHGRCFITTGEAQHLHQLTTDWVKRALANLAAQRGWSWLEAAAASSPGLMLHHSDASDARAARGSPRFPTDR